MEFSMIISIVSLLIALTTLVFSQLRRAKITAFLGPYITLGYPTVGGFSMNIPVTFSNHGVMTGSVFRAAVTLHRRDAPNARYFMQWDSYLKLDMPANRWLNDEIAHALAIPGKSIVAKTILFAWESISQPLLSIREGEYELVFYFWTSDNAVPSFETHRIEISSANLSLLEDTGDPQKIRSISIQLDQNLERNIFMNEYNIRNLQNHKLRGTT
jgi:hypothetical protein